MVDDRIVADGGQIPTCWKANLPWKESSFPRESRDSFREKKAEQKRCFALSRSRAGKQQVQSSRGKEETRKDDVVHLFVGVSIGIHTQGVETASNGVSSLPPQGLNGAGSGELGRGGR